GPHERLLDQVFGVGRVAGQTIEEGPEEAALFLEIRTDLGRRAHPSMKTRARGAARDKKSWRQDISCRISGKAIGPGASRWPSGCHHSAFSVIQRRRLTRQSVRA